MIQINPVWLILLSEVAIALLLLAIVALVLALRKRKQDQKAMQLLIHNIKEGDEFRLQETRELLTEKYKFQSDELEHIIAKIKKSEKEFYQSFINLYLKRQPGDAVQFNSRVLDLTEPYRELEPPQPEISTEITATDEAYGEDDEKLQDLEQQNQRLTEQLQITQETMDRMLNEYASMYDHGKPTEETQAQVQFDATKEISTNRKDEEATDAEDDNQ